MADEGYIMEIDGILDVIDEKIIKLKNTKETLIKLKEEESKKK